MLMSRRGQAKRSAKNSTFSTKNPSARRLTTTALFLCRTYGTFGEGFCGTKEAVNSIMMRKRQLKTKNVALSGEELRVLRQCTVPPKLPILTEHDDAFSDVDDPQIDFNTPLAKAKGRNRQLA